MSASGKITRRGLIGGALLAGLGGKALAQGFAGLGESSSGFEAVVPGRTFSFPGDHGPHPAFRIEWWYVTANLKDSSGTAYGAQWTLFRQAVAAGGPQEGWANQQIWMGHAAVTRADTHRYAQIFARGGVGQAGVEAHPFAFLQEWQVPLEKGLVEKQRVNSELHGASFPVYRGGPEEVLAEFLEAPLADARGSVTRRESALRFRAATARERFPGILQVPLKSRAD